MRFVALGTSIFITRCIEGLRDSGHEVCMLLALPERLRPNNSDDLKPFASDRRIVYFEVGDINGGEALATIQSVGPDFIISAWPRILRRSILEIPRCGVIGSHPTALPFNRGRHPLHWLITLGYSESRLTFFRMDEGIDSGPILLQIPFRIESSDSIGDVVARVNAAAYDGALQLGRIISAKGQPMGLPQDHSRANYWRKRTPHDVTLDLRMSADMIIRTIRSFTAPYPCANLLYEQCLIKIVDAEVAPVEIPVDDLMRMEPGKVLDVSETCIRVKANDRIVDLKSKDPLPKEIRQAKYIHPPSRYLIDHVGILASQLT